MQAIEEIPQQFYQQPIAQVARSLGLEVTDKGPVWWTARCPVHGVHGDRTPSLRINVQEQYWWCFGCSHGSDALELVYWVKHARDPNYTRYQAYLEVVEREHQPTLHDALTDSLADEGRPSVLAGAVALASYLRTIRGRPDATGQLAALDRLLLTQGG